VLGAYCWKKSVPRQSYSTDEHGLSDYEHRYDAGGSRACGDDEQQLE
jgi:hypothetical protein